MLKLIEEQGTLITSYVEELANFDKVEVSFYQIPGSIVRTRYVRSSTETTVEFIPVDSWEYRELERMASQAKTKRI